MIGSSKTRNHLGRRLGCAGIIKTQNKPRLELVLALSFMIFTFKKKRNGE